MRYLGRCGSSAQQALDARSSLGQSTTLLCLGAACAWGFFLWQTVLGNALMMCRGGGGVGGFDSMRVLVLVAEVEGA